MLGGLRLHIRLCNTEALHVFVIFFYVLLRDSVPCYAFLFRPVDYLVVDISKILYVSDIKALIFKVAPHNIKNYRAPCMPYMAVVIDCYPAYVHLYLTWRYRHKFFLLAGHGIMYPHMSSSFINLLCSLKPFCYLVQS